MGALRQLFRGLSLRTEPLYLVKGNLGGVRKFCYSMAEALDWAQQGYHGERITITRVGAFFNHVQGYWRVCEDKTKARYVARII